MSSFKRKIPSSAPPPLPGTKPSPGHVGTVLTSSGIASLDDLLGGGLPLGCNMTVLAPEPRSAYGSLVVKYAIAQGLASGQKVIVVDGQPDQIVRECMWLPKIGASVGGEVAEKSKYKGEDEDKGEEGGEGEQDKIKIAWRYEGMKQFRTTVDDERTSVCEFVLILRLTERLTNIQLGLS
jgi:elongator complex protein 4